MSTAAELAVALGARRSGKEWMARCPAHEDRTPSLSIGNGRDGGAVVHCHAGCTQDAVLAALRDRGLWNGSDPPAGVPSGIPKTWTRKADGRRGSLAAWWTYRDATGSELGHVARYDYSGGEKDFIPHFRRSGRAWRSGAAPRPRPLYGLDRLAARPEAPALIAEGEKAADAAGCLLPDYVAVTWPGGAKAAAAADWSALAGRCCTVWPDYDPPGETVAAWIAAELARHGCEVAMVDVAALGLAPKGDAADLAELPDGELPTQAPPGDDAPRSLALPFGAFMAAEFPPIEEVIPGVLATGAHTLAYSPPGLGKSNLATALAVSLAGGVSTLPGFDVTRPAPVLYLDGEMPAELVQQRFRLHSEMLADPAGLDNRLRIVSLLGTQAASGQRLPYLAVPAGREWLLAELDAFPAEFVVVDTVRALMRHPEHSLNDEDGWRPISELLAELSARRVGVFYLHHAGKGGDQLGTSAREHDPAYVLKLSRSKRAGLGWCRFRLEETKGRMGPSFAPREYVLEPAAIGSATCWTVVDEGVQTKAEAILAQHARHPGAAASTIAEQVSTTPAHVRSVLSKARRGDAT